MREIEFRVWFEKEKRMFNNVYIVGDDVLCALDELEPNGLDVIADINDVIIEQYTGLKDKNGTKIYEGDRVKLDLNNEGYKNSVVVYRDDYMQFMFDHPKEVYTMTEYHFKPKDLQVIGNVHEEAQSD
jgi:uncharacterized phage protein (TIGR01671 family)